MTHRRLWSQFIACLSLLLAFALLAGCSFSLGEQKGAATTPSGQPADAASPEGWTSILKGIRFTDAAGAVGLVASAARPDRVAGCGLTSRPGISAIPVFALSDDGGRTWQTRPIPGAPAIKACYLFADTQRSDSFAVVWNAASSPALAVTSDAGRTWRSLAIPSGFGFGLGRSGNNLIGGHFFAVVRPEGAADFHLAETAIDDGRWTILDEKLPGVVIDHSQLVFTVDPDDTATIFAVTLLSQVLTVVVTHDGGATWRTVLKVPSAHRLALWTTYHHGVAVEQLDGQDAAAQFFFSIDSGFTWQPSGLHYRVGGELMYIGASGRIITQTSIDAAKYNLFTLNPTSGDFSLLGTYDLGPGAPIGVVTDGSSPAFLYGKSDGTYRLPLAR